MSPETVYGLRPRTPSTNRPPGGRRSRRRMRSPEKENGASSSSMSPPSQRIRRSGRGQSSLWELAKFINEGKQVVFITGAGLSAASGVPIFRTTNDSSKLYSNLGRSGFTASTGKKSQGKKGLVEEQPLGIWNQTLWRQAQRKVFRKDPLTWWNDFWLRFFPVKDYENKYHPNSGHEAIAMLQQKFPDSILIITQNVDGLHHQALHQEELDKEISEKLKSNIVEAHGRLNLYKCIPEEDSDTDSSDDEDDDRPVHLGHRRKYRAWKQRFQAEQSVDGVSSTEKTSRPDPPGALSTDISSGSSDSFDCSRSPCKYQLLNSLTVNQLGPPSVRNVLKPDRKQGKQQVALNTAPVCPDCGNCVLPQALLFDEGYHSHEHYNFIKMEDWLASADALVFVGTSFAVTLPLVALDHAREMKLPVFNFNLSDMLESTARLDAENIMGPSQETLPKLWQAVQLLKKNEKSDKE